MLKTVCSIGEELVPFYIGNNCMEELVDVIEGLSFDKLFIGFDENFKDYKGEKFLSILKKRDIPYHVCIISAGEAYKTIESLDNIITSFLQNGCTRSSIVIPFGGGVVGNIFGLAAGLIYRGVRLVHFPTTFLSVHDSVTSQKQAVNCEGYKNNIGLYHLPTAVICDVSVLSSLDEHNVKSGLGELVKNAILFGDESYEVLERQLNSCDQLKFTGESFIELVLIGIKAKNKLLKHDPKEKNIAIIFEYGHTIGHAIELSFPNNKIRHGEAVAIGMLASSYIASKMGIMQESDRKLHDKIVEKIQPCLPAINEDIFCSVFDKVLHDNKRGYVVSKNEAIPMILLRQVGEIHKPNIHYLEYVPESIVAEAIKFVFLNYSSSSQSHSQYISV